MSITEKINIFKKEALRRPGAIATTILLASLFMLGVGLLWTEKYESTATVLVEREKLITPLMEGATATRQIPESQAELAQQIIYSRSVLEEIVRRGGWLEQEEPLTMVQREQLMESFKESLKVENAGRNLVAISYRDADPERAFKVVTTASRQLVERAREANRIEARNAYQFIAAEADRYKERLEEAEERLNAYLDEHGDVRLGDSTAAGANLVELRRNLQEAKLDLESARITERELQAQLESGAAAVTAVTQQDRMNDRIAELQAQLDELQLQYHDTYPDVIAVKQQIETLENRLNGEGGDGGATVSGTNPQRQQIRQRLFDVQTEIAGLERRIQESERLLEEEYARGLDVADTEARAQELNRDYETTREIYEDLLKRRESARMAMEMENDGEALNMAIQDAPTMPLQPSGLNFIHFALLGPFLGVGLALGNLFLRVQYDDRIRAGSTISRDLAVPVLGTVPVLADNGVKNSQRRAWITAVSAIGLLIVCYAFVASLRMTGLL